MVKAHLGKGAIHIGIIILLLFVLTAIFSISISATNTTQGRPFGINLRQALCRQNSTSFCEFNILLPSSAPSSSQSNENSQQPTENQAPLGTGPCFPKGDATGDGILNDFDAQAVLNHIAGTKLIISRFQDQSDVNGDKSITVTDATLIRQYLASRISTFPTCR